MNNHEPTWTLTLRATPWATGLTWDEWCAVLETLCGMVRVPFCLAKEGKSSTCYRLTV